MSHTPGPWEIARYWEAAVNDGSHKTWNPSHIPQGECTLCANSVGRLVRFYAKDDGNFHIHRFPSDDWHYIYASDGTQITGNYECEEGGVCSSEADARLIAAAPELLEALKKCRTMAIEFGAPAFCWTARHKKWMTEIESAIAKAEGRQ